MYPSELTSSRQLAISIASFFVIFTSCGMLFSFGVYQEIYQAMSLEPNTPFTGASAAAIDIIGTLTATFQTMGAPITTAFIRRFSPRVAIFTSAVLFIASSLLASYSQHLWQFVLTQGVLMGLATCFAYMTPCTVAPTWFGARRGLAMGLILSGTGIGGLVWAPAIQALNASLGFRNTLRVSGAITTGLIVVSGFIIDWDPVSKARHAAERERERLMNAERRAQGLPAKRHRRIVPLVSWRTARSGRFCAQLLSAMLQAAAYYTPVFFFSAYARTLGYSAREGANFIAVNNACNAIGKILLGLAADRFGRINMLLLSTAVSAVCSFALWLPSTLTSSLHAGQGLFVTYAILYGCFASAYVSLFPTCLVELFGPQNFASVNGVLYAVRGIGSLFGTPSAGALVDHTKTTPFGYHNMAIMVAALLAASSVSLIWVKIECRKSPMPGPL